MYYPAWTWGFVIAVAALAEYEPPLILLDLGTATTIEVVGKGSTYLGGRIMFF